jgi:ribosomal protein S27AE
MKITATCPKCSSQDILVVTVTDQVEATAIGLTQDAYVCGGCGYVEFFARDPNAIRAVARKLEPRSPFR